jgi:hypothetical protein
MARAAPPIIGEMDPLETPQERAQNHRLGQITVAFAKRSVKRNDSGKGEQWRESGMISLPKRTS